MSDSCHLVDSRPPDSSVRGTLQARMCVSRSVESDFATPWTVAHQAPQSMEFSRQKYWSGLSFPCPGDLSNPGIEHESPTLLADALLSEPPGKLFFLPRLCVYGREKQKRLLPSLLQSLTVVRNSIIVYWRVVSVSVFTQHPC